MILELTDIQKRIKKPVSEEIILDSRVRHTTLRMHVNGVGVEDAIEQLSGLESDEEKELRERLVRSTRATFSTLLRHFDLVFSANGGSVFYDIKDPNFAVYINSLSGGIGLRTWLKQRWKNKLMTDPNGVILIEVDEKGNAAPAYKSINRIKDYVYEGINLEYIIFEPIKGSAMDPVEGVEFNPDGNYYRVIDDASDRFVRVEGEEISVVDELTLPNLWKRVPGVLCSDIVQPESDGKASPVEEVIDVANELLRDTSVHSVYKALHSYPLFWAYLPDCPHCDGTGKDENSGGKCSHCKGFKKDLRKDVSKILGLEPPGEGETSLTPPGGYVQPDIGSWTEQRTEIDWLKREMHYTLWGTHTREEAANETATGKFIDAQPVHSRLDDFATTTEKLEQLLTDLIGEYMFKSYGGSSVSYGRRYLIETPETIWKRYEEARQKGAPRSTLDYLLLQFYEVEFKHQQTQLDVHVKLMKVEPFIHLLESEVIAMPINGEDKATKIYYDEWRKTMSDGDIIIKSAEDLLKLLKGYAAGKYVEPEKQIINQPIES